MKFQLFLLAVVVVLCSAKSRHAKKRVKRGDYYEEYYGSGDNYTDNYNGTDYYNETDYNGTDDHQEYYIGHQYNLIHCTFDTTWTIISHFEYQYYMATGYKTGMKKRSKPTKALNKKSQLFVRSLVNKKREDEADNWDEEYTSEQAHKHLEYTVVMFSLHACLLNDYAKSAEEAEMYGSYESGDGDDYASAKRSALLKKLRNARVQKRNMDKAARSIKK